MPTVTRPHVDPNIREALLEHVARYRMTVLPAMERLPALKRCGRRRVKAWLRALCRSGELGSRPLYRNRHYFFLAGAGPLSEPAKIRNYALLVFCCLGRASRQRLAPHDFQRGFPDLHRPGLSMSYYIDTSGRSPRLGFVRVDMGGHGRWDRVLAKLKHDFQRHWLHPGFRPFIERGAFEIVVITALPQKARRLACSVSEWHTPRAGLIRVCALPELLNLIAPPPC